MKIYFNKRLILFLAIFLVLGILSAVAFCLENVALFIILLVVSLTFAILLSIKFMGFTSVKGKVIALFVFITLFSVGNLGFATNFTNYEKASFGGLNLTITGTTCYSYENVVVLNNVEFRGAIEGTTNYKITVYITGENTFDLGDRICFTSYVLDKSCIYEGNINGNNLSNKYKYYAKVNSEDILLIGNYATIFEKCNLAIRNALLCGMDYNEFSVAYAMLCGNSDFMVEEILTSYRNAGVAHIFAVSGLHIGFLALVLNFVLGKIPMNKIVKLIITFVVLLFYSGICNFSSSSIRAAIMCTVGLFANAIGKRYDPLSSISISAIIILLINPVELLCVGFQLSFTVVLGILILAKPLERAFKFLPNKLASSLATVISAQVASIPICLYAFSKFSLFAVLANIILLPVVCFIFIGLLLLTILSIITGWGIVFLFVPNYVLKGLNFLITIIDYRYFIVGGFTFGAVVLIYYLVVLIASGYFNFSKIVKIISSVSLSVLCVLITLINTLTYNAKTKVYAYGNTYSCASIISSNSQAILVISKTDDFIYDYKISGLINKFNHSVLHGVLFQNGTSAEEAFNTLTIISRLVEIENCYLQFDYTELELLTFTKTFNQINFSILTETTLGNAKIKSCANGFGIEINANNKCAYIISNGQKALLNGNDLTKNSAFVLCKNYLQEINGYLTPLGLISYCKNSFYKDAETYGNFLFVF